MTMTFNRINYKNEVIFEINNELIDDVCVSEIISEVSLNKKIGLDMRNVKAINSKYFIEYLLLDKFKLFNLNSEVLAYLAIILKDGFLKSHINFGDFRESKRELIRRKLYVA